MGHESFERSDAHTGSSNRAFGLVFTSVFLVIGLFPLISGAPLRLWSLIVAFALALVALGRPSLLAPLNLLWTRFGLLLHRIVSPVVLGIMFFAVITPMAIFRRVLGIDSLRLRFDRDASSYWIAREPPGPPPESINNQF